MKIKIYLRQFGIKVKQHKTVGLILLALVFLFYWYQIRPAMIKHNCSWVRHHTDAIPAKPAQGTPATQEQIQNYNKQMADCDNAVNSFTCVINLHNPLNDYHPAVEAQPEKTWYDSSTSQEYQFCIHDRGL